MSNVKTMLAEKLKANQSRHAKAPHESDLELGREHKMVPVDRIDPNPYQPRTTFPEDELEQLAQSIAETGLLQPITVRMLADRYQLIAGERRWRAHQRLGKRTIEAIVQEATDDQMAVSALAENIDRADLSDFEIGKAIQQVESLFPSRKKLAESLGMIREDMYKYFAFDALPSFILELLDTNPRLISRTAATDIKSLLTKTNGSPESLEALRTAMTLVAEKELDQSKVVDYVNRVLRGDAMRGEPTTLPLTQNGMKVGSIKHDTRNVTVTIRSGVLGVKKEKALTDFIATLLT